MHAQGLAQLTGVEGPRIVRMMHRPLELDAVQLRRTVLGNRPSRRIPPPSAREPIGVVAGAPPDTVMGPPGLD